MRILRNILAFDWAFWFQWVVSTTMGWIVGGLLLAGLAFVAAGVSVSILQWLVLVHRMHRAWRWILYSSGGWLAGYLLVVLAVPQELEILNGIVIGLATGLAQWQLLREDFYFSGWWVLFSMIAWTTGLVYLPGFMMTGIVAGGITGILLEVLLRFPKPKSTHEPEPAQ